MKRCLFLVFICFCLVKVGVESKNLTCYKCGPYGLSNCRWAKNTPLLNDEHVCSPGMNYCLKGVSANKSLVIRSCAAKPMDGCDEEMFIDNQRMRGCYYTCTTSYCNGQSTERASLLFVSTFAWVSLSSIVFL